MNQKKRLPIRTLSDMEQEKETIQLTILSECIKNKLELADAIIKAPAVTPSEKKIPGGKFLPAANPTTVSLVHTLKSKAI